LQSWCSGFSNTYPLVMLMLLLSHVILLLWVLPLYTDLLTALPLMWLYLRCASQVEVLGTISRPLIPLLGLAGCLLAYMVYAKHKATRKEDQQKTLELLQGHSQRVSVETIYSQAYQSRMETAYSRQLLEMSKNTPPDSTCIEKLQLFIQLLLRRAKKGHRIALDSKQIAAIAIEATLLKVDKTLSVLDDAPQLLIHNQTQQKQLSADPSFF